MNKHDEANQDVIQLEDGTTVLQCEMCERYLKTEFQGSHKGEFYPFLERGSQMTIVGGYGEFVDLTDIKVSLCHDCTLSIFRKIPKLKNLKGMHSVSIYDDSYPLCCEYSWTSSQVLDINSDEKPRITYGSAENFKPQKSYEVN